MTAMRRSSLARLYPERWRRRYGPEFEALLEDEPLSMSLLFDLLSGALVAHLTYPSEEPLMSTRHVQAATAVLATVASVSTLFALAAAAAKEFLANQAMSAGGPTLLPATTARLEGGLFVAAGVGAALTLGLLGLGWRFRHSAWLRNDLAMYGRVLRRLAPAVIAFAVLCALAVVIVVPVLLIAGNH